MLDRRLSDRIWERCPFCGVPVLHPEPCDECVLGDLARPDGFKKGDGVGGGLGDLKPEA